jgi:hypothetical protein
MPNELKIYQMTIKYTKWPRKRPKGRKVYQHFLFQDHPQFTQNQDFGFENKPSGNPAYMSRTNALVLFCFHFDD